MVEHQCRQQERDSSCKEVTAMRVHYKQWGAVGPTTWGLRWGFWTILTNKYEFFLSIPVTSCPGAASPCVPEERLSWLLSFLLFQSSYHLGDEKVSKPKEAQADKKGLCRTRQHSYNEPRGPPYSRAGQRFPSVVFHQMLALNIHNFLSQYQQWMGE